MLCNLINFCSQFIFCVFNIVYMVMTIIAIIGLSVFIISRIEEFKEL